MQNLDIEAIHIDLDSKLKKYVMRKLGGLDKYVSRHVRDDVYADVKLKGSKSKDKSNESTCQMSIRLPKETLTVSESTINMYAAIDIVEEKMKQKLKKYKSLHANPKLHQRALARLRGRTS